MDCKLIEIRSLIRPSMPTTCSTTFVNENSLLPNSRFSSIQARSAKRTSKPLSTGLQKDSGKELSRLLRTESAILGIEKKVNSKKYNNLWPKAILEALDDAIRRNNWESALKVLQVYISLEN